MWSDRHFSGDLVPCLAEYVLHCTQIKKECRLHVGHDNCKIGEFHLLTSGSERTLVGGGLITNNKPVPVQLAFVHSNNDATDCMPGEWGIKSESFS